MRLATLAGAVVGLALSLAVIAVGLATRPA